MQCSRCIYWDGSWNTESANCTRYPKWQETEKEHFCGEFKGELMGAYRDGGTGVPIAKYYYGMINEARKEENVVRKKNTELRKQNKQLRDMYKKDTGKIARCTKPAL